MAAGRNSSSWTREQAQAAARRSAEVRTAKAAQRRLASSKAAALAQSPPAEQGRQRQLTILTEEITRTRALLASGNANQRCPTCRRPFGIDARERAALLKALRDLLDHERVLLDIPSPGSRKPGRRGEGEQAPRPAGGPEAFRILDEPSPAPAQTAQPPQAQPPIDPSSAALG